MSSWDELPDRRHFSESIDAVLYTRPRFTTIFFPLFSLLFFAVLGWLAFVPFDQIVHARGDVRVAGDAMPVQSEQQGRLTAIASAEGAFVEQGAILFELDATPARIDLERLGGEIARAEETIGLLQRQRERARSRGAAEIERVARDLSRHQTMFERGLVSKQVVENLESERRALTEASRQEQLAIDAEVVAARQSLARATSERAQKNVVLAHHTIRSPRSGVLSRLHVRSPGSVVSRGAVLAEITPRGRPMEFEAVVSPHDIGRVRPDQPVRVKLDAYPYRQFGTVAGRVSFVAPDRGERGYRIRVAMDQDNRSVTFRTGMTGSLEIISDRRPLYRFVGERLGFVAAAHD